MQRWYRGDILAVADTNLNLGRTVNRVKLEQYLRGVVPRESPASWGSQGAGAGMHALRAQAIAARSYAWAEGRYTYSGMAVKTCDTASCQVYMGFGSATSFGGVMTRLEDARTDAAIAETAGVVRLMGTGSVARTEFSSSTGGHTVPGTFSAVVDAGDSIPSNPNHTWKTQISTTAIENAWPTIGTFTGMTVTARNGLGDYGGRAQTVVISGTGGKVTATGNEVRSRLGLKSDWFRVYQAPSGGIGGYWLADTKGAVYTFGNAGAHGSASSLALNKPMVGMERTVSGDGYWMVASDGGIFSYGDARFLGSTGNIRLNKPIVGMERTPSGNGYWMVASDGGIFSYGDAGFFGSTGAMTLNQPIVGMAATPTGQGYWLVASDGGVFSFGDAQFFGSTGSIKLAKPIVGMASSPDAAGYWMIASDGGLFAFGNATYRGSLPGLGVSATAIGMEPTATGGGYLIATTAGAVHSFGDAPVMGGLPDVDPTFSGTVRDLVAAAG
jgi:SpoIID/LytB domain protein